MTWKEVTTSDLFREANPEERAEYKRQFFQKYGVPTLREQGLDDDELNIAANAFFSAPDDTGEGYVTSLASSAARGLLRPVSDIPIAVGALTGSEGIESFGQDIQAGIESALPVNPAQEGIGTELAGIGGQVGSILLGGGGGALAGRAIAGTAAAKLGAKAAVGTQAFTGGASGGAQAADQLGLEGGQKQLRALLGGVTELGVEAIPFGMAAETGAVRKLFGETVESGWMSPVIKGAGTEAVEEGATETIGQATDIAFAPDKAQMDLKQIGKAMLLGGAGGAMFGGVEAAITPRTKRAFDGSTDFVPSTTPPPGMTVEEAEAADLLALDDQGRIIGYKKPPAPVTTETIEAELPVEVVTPEAKEIISNVVATPEASATAAALARTAVELGEGTDTQQVPTADTAPAKPTTKAHTSNQISVYDTEGEAQAGAKVAATLFSREGVAIRKNADGKFEVHTNAFDDVRADKRFTPSATVAAVPIDQATLEPQQPTQTTDPIARMAAAGAGSSIIGSDGEVDRAATQKSRQAKADAMGVSLEELNNLEASEVNESKQAFWDSLGNGDVITWVGGDGGTRTAEVEVTRGGTKYVVADNGYEFDPRTNEFIMNTDTLSVSNPSQKQDVPLPQETLQQEQGSVEELPLPRGLPVVTEEQDAPQQEAAGELLAADEATLARSDTLGDGIVQGDDTLKQKEPISVAEDAVVADGGAMLDEDTQVSPEPTGALPTASLPATGQPTLGSVGEVAKPTPDPRDKTYEKLLGKGKPAGLNMAGLSESQVPVSVARKLYSDRDIQRGLPSRPQETQSFYLRPKAEVTGVPTDRGWILKDKRPDFAKRFTNAPTTPQETKAPPPPSTTQPATKEPTEPQPAAEATGDAVETQQRPLSRSKPREAIVFKKPIKTPLGNVIGYSWSSQIIEDVDKDGEAIFRRISNWDEAANNAETGRDIVHRFQILKPDGTTSEVSLESTLGKMTAGDKKTVKAVISAAKRLPFMRAELAELKELQDAAKQDYNRSRTLKPDRSKLELKEPDAKWLRERGVKQAYLDGVFLENLESSDLTESGDLRNQFKFWNDNTWKWQGAQIKAQFTDAQKVRIESLERSIKKAESLLKEQDVTVSAVTTEPTSLAESGPPDAEMKNPSVTTGQPASISIETPQTRLRSYIATLPAKAQEAWSQERLAAADSYYATGDTKALETLTKTQQKVVRDNSVSAAESVALDIQRISERKQREGKPIDDKLTAEEAVRRSIASITEKPESARAKAVQAGLAGLDWANMDTEQRRAAVNKFAQSTARSLLDGASSLKRDAKLTLHSDRPPSAKFNVSNGALSVEIGTNVDFDSLSFKDNEESALSQVFAKIEEEFIHAVHGIAAFERWKKSGSETNFNDWFEQETFKDWLSIFESVKGLRASGNNEAADVIENTIFETTTLYHQGVPAEMLGTMMQQQRPAYKMYMELARMLAQVELDSFTSETEFTRFVKAVNHIFTKVLGLMRKAAELVKTGALGEALGRDVSIVSDSIKRLQESAKFATSLQKQPPSATTAEFVGDANALIDSLNEPTLQKERENRNEYTTKSLKEKLDQGVAGDSKRVGLEDGSESTGQGGMRQSITRSSDGAVISTGVNPTSARAARNSYIGVIPGAEQSWLGTVAEFEAEFGDTVNFGGGLTNPGTAYEALVTEDGRVFIFTDNVQILEGDKARSETYGTTPGVEAVKRLMRHESFGHRGFMALPTPLKQRFMDMAAAGMIPEADLDALVNERGYAHLKDWRTVPAVRQLAAEEWLAQRMERMQRIPKSGPMQPLLDWLRDVWRWLTGGETDDLVQLRDIMREMHRALGGLEPGQRIVTVGDAVRPSYIGERAEMSQFMRDSLDTAKSMAAAGKSSEEIRAVTGWFPGKYDGKMRWELPDNGASLTGRIPKLGSKLRLDEVLNHPSLFDAYPNLRGSEVWGKAFPGKTVASFNTAGYFEVDPRSGEFMFGRGISTLLHETQHAIQKEEGFAEGGSPAQFVPEAERLNKLDKMRRAVSDARSLLRTASNLFDGDIDAAARFFAGPPYKQKFPQSSIKLAKRSTRQDLDEIDAELLQQKISGIKDEPNAKYKRLAGEIEARDVEARRSMSLEERAKTPPYSSESIAKEDAIIILSEDKKRQMDSVLSKIPFEEQSGSTQVATTTGSYRTAAQILKNAKVQGENVLDYGAGLGLGSDALRETFQGVDSLEVNPGRWQGSVPPRFTSSEQVDRKYSGIVNLNVLNVVPRNIRDSIVRHIGELLEGGGVAVFGVRKWTDDVNRAKKAAPGAEEKSIIIDKKQGPTFQKGFDGNELVEYLQEILGSGFEVRKANIAANGAIVRKLADATAPYSSENIAPEDAIVMFGGGDIRASRTQSPQAARHAALEAKFNDGTITAEETAEAEAIVAEVARGAGYDTKAWHATRHKGDITEFKTRSKSINSLGLLGEAEVSREAAFFTDSERFAEAFGGRISPYFLDDFETYDATTYVKERDIRERFMDWLGYGVPSSDPDSGLNLSDKAKYAHNIWQFLDGELGVKFREFLIEEGKSGIRFGESTEDAVSGEDVEGVTIAVFNPNQIKSAAPFTGVPLDNRFDSTSNDIRASRTQSPQAARHAAPSPGGLTESEVLEKHGARIGGIVNEFASVLRDGDSLTTEGEAYGFEIVTDEVKNGELYISWVENKTAPKRTVADVLTGLSDLFDLRLTPLGGSQESYYESLGFVKKGKDMVLARTAQTGSFESTRASRTSPIRNYPNLSSDETEVTAKDSLRRAVSEIMTDPEGVEKHIPREYYKIKDFAGKMEAWTNKVIAPYGDSIMGLVELLRILQNDETLFSELKLGIRSGALLMPSLINEAADRARKLGSNDLANAFLQQAQEFGNAAGTALYASKDAKERFTTNYWLVAMMDLERKSQEAAVDPKITKKTIGTVNNMVPEAGDEAAGVIGDAVAEEEMIAVRVLELGVASQTSPKMRALLEELVQLTIDYGRLAEMGMEADRPSISARSALPKTKEERVALMEKIAKRQTEILKEIDAENKKAKASPAAKQPKPVETAKQIINKITNTAAKEPAKKKTPDAVRELYRKQLKTPMSDAEFAKAAREAGLSGDVIKQLKDAIDLEIAAIAIEAKKRADKRTSEKELKAAEDEESANQKKADAKINEVAERLSDPSLTQDKVKKVDEFRELYEQQIREPLPVDGFVDAMVALEVDESTAQQLFDIAALDADSRQRVRDARADIKSREISEAQASRLIYSQEETLRQGSKDREQSADGDSINKAFREQVAKPMPMDAFVERLGKLKVTKATAERMYRTAERVAVDNEAAILYKQRSKFLDVDTAALANFVNELRRGGKLTGKAIKWADLLSLPVAHQETIRAQLLERVKKHNVLRDLSASEQVALADALEKIWQRERRKIFQRMIKRADLAGVSKDTQATIAEAAPAMLRYINQGMLGTSAFYRAVGEKFGIEPFSAESIAKIEKLAAQMQEPDTTLFERDRLAKQLTEELQRNTVLPMAEVLSSAWVTSVLSGLATQMDMALNVSTGMLSIAKKVIATIISTKSTKEARAGLSAFGSGLIDAARIAWPNLLDKNLNLLPIDADSSMAFLADGGKTAGLGTGEKMMLRKGDKPQDKLYRALGAILAFYNRLFSGLDFIVSSATAAGTFQMAAALNPQLYDAALIPSKQDKINALKQAQIRLPSGTRAEQLAMSLRMLDDGAHLLGKKLDESAMQRYKQMQQDVKMEGRTASYQEDPTGLGGVIYDSIKSATAGWADKADKARKEVRQRIADKRAVLGDETNWNITARMSILMLDALYLAASQAQNALGLRFMRFAGNKFNELISYIPVFGLVRLEEAGMHRDGARTLRGQNILHNQAIGLMAGTLLLWAMKALNEDDEERGWIVNGSWKNLTPERKKQQIDAGFKENSISFLQPDGTWRSYNYISWPLAGWLASFGAISDYKRLTPDKWDEKSLPSKIAAGVYAGVSSVSDISSLSNLAEMFGRSSNTTDPAKSFSETLIRAGSSYVGGFVPKVIKDMETWIDGNYYKPEEPLDFLAKELPFYRRSIGAPLRDIFAEPIQIVRTPWRRIVQQSKDDPAYKNLAKLNARGLWLTPPNPKNRKVRRGGATRDLTSQEADAYVTEVGKAYKRLMESRAETFLKMPVERAEQLIEKAATRIREIALRKALAGAKSVATVDE